jgi:8-oxo-dGTP pyrophosphatase MutT (NUDIX family)
MTASDRPWTAAELMFGRRTGRHSHPATHPRWLEFSDDDCPVCGSVPPEGRAMTGRTYTHPEVFTLGVAEGWAEAETDPTRIDWPARQAAAAIPFEVSDGHPVNPCETTAVRHGRNEMGYWGETRMADTLVTVTLPPFGARYLLMVERGDGYGWAVPGGHVEPGEPAMLAAVRELAEETGLAVFGDEPFLTLETFHVLPPRYVPDPRASDEAWAVTIPVHIGLGTRDTLPAVTGGDDARRAEWVPADSYGYLTDALEDRHAGGVFAAHVSMLRQFLPATRATGQGSEDAAAKLDAVRGVLSAFDWEHDDRQHALEEIERIVTGPLPGCSRGDGA